MAEQEDRTEEASHKKLEDAKKKGDVPRSSDFTAAWVVFGAAAILLKLASWWGTSLFQSMIVALSFSSGHGTILQGQSLMRIALQDVSTALLVFSILGVLLVGIAVTATLSVGGWVWSPEKIWDWKRLSPVQGLKKPFTQKGVSVLWQDLLKTAALGATMFVLLWAQKGQWFHLLRATPSQAIPRGLSYLSADFLLFSGLLLLPGVIDLVLQRRFFVASQKMSHQEVRDEYKEMNGNQQVKGKIRALRRKMARLRMMKSVETATVIVTNPEHFSVALLFTENMSVPVLVAKGIDVVAFRIRDIARQHGVPILEAPAVARSLHKFCEIGEPIPAGLYEAVAIVLAYIDHLDRAKAGLAPMPKDWRTLGLGSTLGRDFEETSLRNSPEQDTGRDI
ncbi:EscU/YscU/HrcU family type III secretion system export apparatus switch protein [Acidithiobacillus ferrooxidans]|uniref:EscU/YscU/HrcU family type III secretion system export apparatus switch protein n=1 Tax=Acidithiobacillus ferrooxidans TaxID=920 RepID=UPI001C077C35|nr:flagellar type III secretion system protein FlhB [Acidithiobacillus ferrooxidans]MBU2857343.1 EscU/YscU/HrcU family type III secretion system export apparatus switch protein [Acidithiobacillus ferrooxidans]